MFIFGFRAIHQKNISLAIKEAKGNGFEVLEMHLSSPQFLHFDNLSQSPKITLQIHAPIGLSLIFTEEKLRKASKEYLKEIIELSKNINARCLTLHIGRADTYHETDGKKIKNDDVYPDFYSKLFEDSLKYIVSIAPKDLFICIENTDNFNYHYQKIIEKYLKTGKLFLTWDIRKSYSYDTEKLIKEQWDFVKKNKKYVKNIHISGLEGSHGEIKKWDKRFDKFINLFKDKDMPMIIEIIPLSSAIKAKMVISQKLKY